MKLLLLAPQVPWPPSQGTALRNLNIIRQLARRHAVTLLTFGPDGTDVGALTADGIDVVLVPPPPVRPLARRFRDLWLDPVPDLARRLTSPAMATRLAELLDHRYDVVQIEGFEMAPYGLSVPRGVGRPRLIYDAHNAEWVLQDRAWRADIRRLSSWPGAGYSLIQTQKIRRYEAQLVATVDATIAVSAPDAAVLAALAPTAGITVVPNGVDTEFYQPTGAAAEDAGRCVFTGKMDFRPNIDAMTWFVREVWPRIQAVRPDSTLAIVGRDPAPAVRALADDNIEVTGAVDDVRPWLARANVVVVPLRIGGGTRLKVLEAMAMGKAVVATRLAVEGLHVTDGAEARLADTPTEFTNAVVALLADTSARRVLGEHARTRVEAEYRWEALIPAMAALYQP